MANLNINQFSQVPVRGQTDLQISKSGVISAQISANQATALNPGDWVKLDSANTSPVPQLVASAVGDTGLGCLIYDVKRSSFSAGDYVEVAGLFGTVIWLVAGGTIAPGAAVEDNGSDQVVTKSANAQKGIALDPGTTGNLLRVMLTPPVVA